MIDYRDYLPRTAHMYPIDFAHFNSTLNPILYAMSNKKFKKGYKKIIDTLLYRIKQTITTDTIVKS